MDANNINTGVSQKNDEFTWFKPSSSAHFEGVKISAPDFSIPPTPASSYSNLHVVLDHVHPSTQTTTRTVLPPHSYSGPFTGPMVGSLAPSTLPSSSMASRGLANTPSFTSAPSRDLLLSTESTTLYDNKLDNVPSSTFRAVPDTVNPELPGARGFDALTSLKSEIAPIQPSFVPLEEFDELAERTDRQLPESVDLPLTDESQKWSNNWNMIGQDVRSKNWNLHHYTPERDSFWAKQWNTVGNDIKNKSWNLRRTKSLPASFKMNSWPMIDQLEEAERRWRQVRGINGTWSGRINRVHHELLNSVAPVGWAQWFFGLKNRVAKAASDDLSYVKDTAVADYDYVKDSAKGLVRTLSDSATKAKDAALDFANQTADVAVADYDYAKDTAKDLASRAADVAAADYDIVKDSAKGLVRTLSDSAFKAADTAAGLANAATSVIADKIVDLTTTPLPKYTGPALWSEYEFYAPQLPRRAPADIIALEEAERADRMSRGINPVISGLWYRLGREMLHTYRDDLAELFSGLRLNLTKKGANLVESAKGAINSFSTYKAPESAVLPRGYGYNYETLNFDWSGRVPADIIALEEEERVYRIKRGINPIVSGLWYRLGLELKYKYSLRPTLASAASKFTEVAADFASKAYEKLSEVKEEAVEKGRELLTTPPKEEFGPAHLNLFAYTAEPIDFTFKSRRCPADIKALEEKERAERIAEGVDALAYSKWNALLSESHKTLADGSSLTSSVLPVLASAKESLVESGKGITGYFGSWAHTMADKAASYIDSAKHTHLFEAAMDYVHPDPASISSLNKSEEIERARRMNEKVDPMLAARRGRVQEELLQSIKSV